MEQYLPEQKFEDDPQITLGSQQADEDPRIVERLQQLPMAISNFSLNKNSSGIRYHPWLPADRGRLLAKPPSESKTMKQVLTEYGYTIPWDPRASAIPLGKRR
jgi:hypothetical protein